MHIDLQHMFKFQPSGSQLLLNIMAISHLEGGSFSSITLSVIPILTFGCVPFPLCGKLSLYHAHVCLLICVLFPLQLYLTNSGIDSS